MFPNEHSAILLTFRAFCNTFSLLKLPLVIKIFVLSIFECPFYTGGTVGGIDWHKSTKYILEDLKVLRRSPDLLNNVKIGQG